MHNGLKGPVHQVQTKMSEIQQTTKTSFLKVMGTSPINRVLDFLIENDRESWSMLEISKKAKIGYSTLKIILPRLEKEELIIVQKEIGKIKLYKINKENLIVRKLYSLYNQINIIQIERFK